MTSFQLQKKYIAQENDHYVVAKAEILNEYGRYIPEFEGNLLTFVKKIPPVMSWREFCEFDINFNNEIVCLLSNWDGVFWDVYTEKNSILKTLTTQHINDKNLEIYHIDSKIDYPNPLRPKNKLKPI